MSRYTNPRSGIGRQQSTQEPTTTSPRPTIVTTTVPSAFSNMSVTVSATVTPSSEITAQATITAVPYHEGQGIQQCTQASSGLPPSTVPHIPPVEVSETESVINDLQNLSLDGRPRSASVTSANTSTPRSSSHASRSPWFPSTPTEHGMAFAGVFGSPNNRHDPNIYTRRSRSHAHIQLPARHHRSFGDPQSSDSHTPAGTTLQSAPSVASLQSSVHSSRPLTPALSSNEGGKWYVVTIGRRTGVFPDWSHAQELVEGISGNSHKSFNTRDAAYSYYNRMKAAGRVEVRRKPGDDIGRFGTVEEAMA